jgi:hypothetical protein
MTGDPAFAGSQVSVVDSPRRGFTITDVAKRFRVRRFKALGWIRRGELSAINTAEPLQRPRFVVTAEALAEFESRRQRQGGANAR